MTNKIQEFWNKNLDWKFIESNLASSSFLKKYFTKELLVSFQVKPPYFIHPLSRLLNIRCDLRNVIVQKYDSILNKVKICNGFLKKVKLLRTGNDPACFWDLCAELEIGAALIDLGFEVCFIKQGNSPGPDIEAKKNGEIIFVEVMLYKKFFRDIYELEEIVNCVNNVSTTLKKYKAELSIGRNMGIRSALGESFTNFAERILCAAENDELIRKVLEKYPIIVHEDSNLALLIEGDDSDKYDPGVAMKYGGGVYDDFMDRTLIDITQKKNDFEQLKNSKGLKIVIVSVLFHQDFQLISQTHPQLAIYRLPEHVDFLMFLATGVNEKMDFSKGVYVKQNGATQRKIEKLLGL